MKINLAYKFRLYPTEEQEQNLKRKGGNTRFVWNKLLGLTNDHKEATGKYFTRKELQEIEKSLRGEYSFLGFSYSQSTQYQCLTLAKSIEKAFSVYVTNERNKAIDKAKKEPDEKKRNKLLAKAINYGFPKFKKKHKLQDSIHHPQHFEIVENKIKIPKVGWILFCKHREIDGLAKNITISQFGGHWFVSICCEKEIEQQPIVTDNIVGIDVGLTTFATLTDQTTIANPRLYRKAEKKIKKTQKQLSRKAKGSKRRLAQQRKLAAQHRRVKNRRQDFLHKVTHCMITKYDGFILEDLSSKNMMQNHKLAKSIQDASWSEFSRMLEYKSHWNSKHFEKIDRWCPTSQICYKCKHRQDMPLENRTFVCGNCGNVVDRDYNASLNIKDFSVLYAVA